MKPEDALPNKKEILKSKVPSQFLPLLDHPQLSRHIYLNNHGDVVKARICHDLNNLPYDKEDIMKVPYNRQYKREKLVLLENPLSRPIIQKQSMTVPNLRKQTTTGETLSKCINRVKLIYGKGHSITLNRDFDEKRREEAKDIVRRLDETHPLKMRSTKRWYGAGSGAQVGQVREEVLEWRDEKKRVEELEAWQRSKGC